MTKRERRSAWFIPIKVHVADVLLTDDVNEQHGHSVLEIGGHSMGAADECHVRTNDSLKS